MAFKNDKNSSAEASLFAFVWFSRGVVVKNYFYDHTEAGIMNIFECVIHILVKSEPDALNIAA